jgi:hypothetical protein
LGSFEELAPKMARKTALNLRGIDSQQNVFCKPQPPRPGCALMKEVSEQAQCGL